jgi:hypothetical protein
MSQFDEVFQSKFMPWAEASMKTQAAQDDYEAAQAMADEAHAKLIAAINDEQAAFDALQAFRDDVVDGGWHPEALPAAPEVSTEPEAAPLPPVAASEAPSAAEEATPVPEVAPMTEEPAAVAADEPATAADQEAFPALDPMEDGFFDEELPLTASETGLTLPNMTDDSLVSKL